MTSALKYKDIATQALEAEKKAQWTEAARLWDEAKSAARAQKRSSAEAVEHAMLARQKAEAAPTLLDAKSVDIAERVATELDRQEGKVLDIKTGAVVEKKAAKGKPKLDAAREAGRAETETKRAVANGLKPGDAVKHTRQGKVVAECTWVGPGEWVYDGQKFASLNKAKEVAARAIGMKPAKDGKFDSISAWKFWGVEKREDA